MNYHETHPPIDHDVIVNEIKLQTRHLPIDWNRLDEGTIRHITRYQYKMIFHMKLLSVLRVGLVVHFWVNEKGDVIEVGDYYKELSY